MLLFFEIDAQKHNAQIFEHNVCNLYLSLSVGMLPKLEYGENVANNDDQGLEYGNK